MREIIMKVIMPTRSSDSGPASAGYCLNCGASTRAVTFGECDECGADCYDACGYFLGSDGRMARTILHCKECGPDWFRCADCGSTRATVSAAEARIFWECGPRPLTLSDVVCVIPVRRRAQVLAGRKFAPW